MADSVVVTGSRIAEEEDLGDYKLYNTPEPTTVAAYQTKQIAFLDKPDVELKEPADNSVVPRSTIFRVSDCRSAYDHLRARGAEFLTEPVDHGYEIRAFFRDPDGHLFEISELVGKANASD